MICIGLVYYKVYLGLNGEYISVFVSFVLSFLITTFVLDKFKYSDNFIIGFLQRFILLTIFLFISSFCLFYIFSFFGATIYADTSDTESVNTNTNNTNNNNNNQNDNQGTENVTLQSRVSQIVDISQATDSTNKDYYTGRMEKKSFDNLV